MHVIAQPLSWIGLHVSPITPARPKTATVGEAMAPASGALAINLPGTVSPDETHAGLRGHSVIDDYYDAIHVRPTELRVGNITARVVRQVEVWNAYFAERTIEQLIITGGEGIDLFGPTLPHTLGQLASTLFTVEVTSTGPATVNARYVLEFGPDEGEPGWRVLGQRIIEWSIPPNWRQAYEETLSYRTEVITAHDGDEQRIGLRQAPRRDLAFTPLVDGQAKRTYQRLLSTWQNRVYAMADWARGVGTQGVPAGGQEVPLVEPIPELVVGQLIALRYGERSQVIEVMEISANGLAVTLNSPVAESFPAGSRAYPALIVHADASLPSRRLTAGVATASLAFREMHRQVLPAQGEPDLVWRGREVMLRSPNWAQPLDHDHEYPFEWVDVGRGPFGYRTPQRAPKDVRRLHYLVEGREEVRWFERFFARIRGRRGEFYAPTWDRDLEVSAETLLEGSFQLPIDDEREIGRPDNDLVYRNVCVRLRDGTVLLRQVVSGEMGQSGPALILAEGWPRNISRDEILVIHYMPRWRSATDSMTVTWVTDGVARITLAFQTLRDA